MVLPEHIDAVVFDMGGVFIVPDPAVVSEILRRGGLECEIPPELAADIVDAMRTRLRIILAHEMPGADDAAPAGGDAWAAELRAPSGATGAADVAAFNLIN